MKGLLAQMLTSTAEDAEQARWLLEARYLPNEVLKAEADELTQAVFDGLGSASAEGVAEGWELLSEIAGGCVGETAADPELVEKVRTVLVLNSDTALLRLANLTARPYDFLAVDVVDAMLEFAGPELHTRCLEALDAFARRGPRERARAAVIRGTGGG